MIITNFKIFENLDKANKLIKDLDSNLQGQFSYFYDFLRSKGLQNYAGFITNSLLKDDYPATYILPEYGESYENIQRYDIYLVLDYIKRHKINTEKLNDKNYEELLNWWLETSELNKIKKELIDICPSNLREELRSILNDDEYKNNIEKLKKYYPIKDKKLDLIKKGSRYKNAKDWINYIVYIFTDKTYQLEGLKKSNIEIIYEDDLYLIYRPLDYKSYMIVDYPHWCTIEEKSFNNYFNFYFLVYLNKKDIKGSYCSYLSKLKNEVEFFDYKSINIDEDEIQSNKWLMIGKNNTENQKM